MNDSLPTDQDLVFPGMLAKGLTKRELFAAMAMQGFCALPGIGDDSTAKTIASMAVEHADALLAELAKVTP